MEVTTTPMTMGRVITTMEVAVPSTLHPANKQPLTEFYVGVI